MRVNVSEARAEYVVLYVAFSVLYVAFSIGIVKGLIDVRVWFSGRVRHSHQRASLLDHAGPSQASRARLALPS